MSSNRLRRSKSSRQREVLSARSPPYGGSGSLQTKAPKTLHFSGYDWDIRQFPSNRGGDNTYLADNAWTDGDGFLHLRIARRSDEWISSDAAKS